MREPDNTHVCPVQGCTVADVPEDKLMCPYHWYVVPLELRRALVFEWNHGRPRPVYLATRQRAIDAASRAVRR